MASPGCDPLHRLCHHNRHHRHHCHHHYLLHLHHHRHHHCHHRFSPCALHTHHIHCRCQGFHNVTPIPPNPESIVPFPIGNNSYGEAVEYKEADSSAAQISQELEHLDLDEEEDEPIFVLTDEWREFFAKSEARRQQEKKQRKKGKK